MSNASVIDAIKSHHDTLSAELSTLTSQVLHDAKNGDAVSSRTAMVEWCRSELLPHAAAEERTIYDAGTGIPEARLLVRAMGEEHLVIQAAVISLADATGPVQTAAAAATVKALFDNHLTKENDLLLPVLDSAGIDLAPLLAGMHQVLGE